MPVARAFGPPGAGSLAPAARAVPAVAVPLACGACLLAGAAYIVAVDPGGGGGLTSCPIRAATGRWCPGCGLTRATHHLLRGDVLQALSLNVMAPLILAALAVAWWSWLRVVAGRGAPRWVVSIGWSTYASAVAAVAVFVVLRNLPGWEWLRGGL